MFVPSGKNGSHCHTHAHIYLFLAFSTITFPLSLLHHKRLTAEEEVEEEEKTSVQINYFVFLGDVHINDIIIAAIMTPNHPIVNPCRPPKKITAYPI